MEAEQFKLIDTAVGLFFIFLIVSIMVTAAVELIGAVLRLRSVNLVQGLIWMLGDAPDPAAAQAPGMRSRLAQWIIGHRRVPNPSIPVVGNEAAAAAPDSLTAQILKHPLINNLAAGDRVAPHIDPKLFAAALVSVLNDAKNNTSPFADLSAAFADVGKLVSTAKNDAVRNTLGPMIAQAEAAADGADAKTKAALTAVEQWYDHSMSQASDWYKARIQGAALVLATLAAVAGNVDSVRIVSALWLDNGLRQNFAAQATAAAADPDYLRSICPDKQGAEAVTCGFAAARQAANELDGLPVGWSVADYTGADFWSGLLTFLGHIPGWIVTIAAASLGAPFWFGVLQRVTPLRNVGANEAK